MNKQRDIWKLQANLKRGGFGEWCLCDLCQKRKGIQYHELIARSKTVGNKEARELSFQPELCSLLCQQCHDEADRKVVAYTLWEFNKKLWGINQVIEAFNRLQAVMRTQLVIPELKLFID